MAVEKELESAAAAAAAAAVKESSQAASEEKSQQQRTTTTNGNVDHADHHSSGPIRSTRDHKRAGVQVMMPSLLTSGGATGADQLKPSEKPSWMKNLKSRKSEKRNSSVSVAAAPSTAAAASSPTVSAAVINNSDDEPKNPWLANLKKTKSSLPVTTQQQQLPSPKLPVSSTSAAVSTPPSSPSAPSEINKSVVVVPDAPVAVKTKLEHAADANQQQQQQQQQVRRFAVRNIIFAVLRYLFTDTRWRL